MWGRDKYRSVFTDNVCSVFWQELLKVLSGISTFVFQEGKKARKVINNDRILIFFRVNYAHLHISIKPHLGPRIFDENLSASFSRLREYSSWISALRRKNSCRSCNSWIRASDCCSRHLNCSTNWLRISEQQSTHKHISLTQDNSGHVHIQR